MKLCGVVIGEPDVFVAIMVLAARDELAILFNRRNKLNFVPLLNKEITCEVVCVC